MATKAIRPVFQPIISLATNRVAGYEALARGPSGSTLSTPRELFSRARNLGRLADLDWLAQAAAYRAALTAQLPKDVPLFVNVEPSALRSACPPNLAPIIDQAAQELQIVIEITERSLGDDPAALLESVALMRERSARIAIDDVGVNPSSLALMSLLGPDVIKIDRSVVQGRTTRATAKVVNAVMAESDRTGAVILAEGIENEDHLRTALSMGATLGQGWLFGRPGPLPARHELPGNHLPRHEPAKSSAGTPFDVAQRRHTPVRTTKQRLLPLSNHIEAMGSQAPEAMVLLATFQQQQYFDDATRHRYTAMAAGGALTAVFAQDMPAEPAKGIHGCPLDPADPLIGEWTVIILNSYFAGALFAKEVPSALPDPQREFDMIVSYDRATITEAAHQLLHRMPPTSSPVENAQG
ncbi:sensor domain-containing phosphodiesterase [Rhizocola hellebori]|nr:EAL domain-containing protein [Rhizocola hellebori]